MTRWVTVILAGVLTGCLNLPGSDAGAPARYTLQGPAQACVPVARALALDIAQVVGGLDTDRIALLREETGEVTYLRDLRWTIPAGAMLEHRLAADLECKGTAVQTGHRARAGQSQLLCEVRALNLRDSGRGQVAEIALSCLYRERENDSETALLPSARVPLDGWSATAAIHAFNTAYSDVFGEIYQGISDQQASTEEPRGLGQMR